MSLETRQGKILIIEDDRFVRSNLKISLQKQGVADIDICEAENLSEARDFLHEDQFAIILLDRCLNPNDGANTDGLLIRGFIDRSEKNNSSYIIDISSNSEIPNVDEVMRLKTFEIKFDSAAKRIIEIRKTLTPIRNPNG